MTMDRRKPSRSSSLPHTNKPYTNSLNQSSTRMIARYLRIRPSTVAHFIQNLYGHTHPKFPGPHHLNTVSYVIIVHVPLPLISTPLSHITHTLPLLVFLTQKKMGKDTNTYKKAVMMRGLCHSPSATAVCSSDGVRAVIIPRPGPTDAKYSRLVEPSSNRPPRSVLLSSTIARTRPPLPPQGEMEFFHKAAVLPRKGCNPDNDNIP